MESEQFESSEWRIVRIGPQVHWVGSPHVKRTARGKHRADSIVQIVPNTVLTFRSRSAVTREAPEVGSISDVLSETLGEFRDDRYHIAGIAEHRWNELRDQIDQDETPIESSDIELAIVGRHRPIIGIERLPKPAGPNWGSTFILLGRVCQPL